jgi:hypothetical protein
MTGISKSQVIWLDATYLKVRQNGRIVSVAVIVAVGVDGDGRREVLGLAIGPSEAETFWTMPASRAAASSPPSSLPSQAGRPSGGTSVRYAAIVARKR